MPNPLVLTPLAGIPRVRPGDDLPMLLLEALGRAEVRLEAGDILAVTQKIVSKAEGRLVHLPEVRPSPEARRLAEESQKDPRLVEVILRESRQVMRVRPGLIIVRHRLGFVCANAGVDHSNVLGEGGPPEDWVLRLPEDPDASARRIRERLEQAAGVPLGVVILDSHGRAWRMGTVGVAIGISGMPALLDLRGRPDLFGYRLQVTQVGIADELAAAVSVVTGQAAEGIPAVHVRGLPYPLREGSLGELIRPEEQDLFR
ncbi:MAG TPA: coenzyme F420-0:L-glutamate ligase [Anaerolineales bacterium]|nr:coenzyme F420-0:L-glutamate ligase [Anaerolineales bacterium]